MHRTKSKPNDETPVLIWTLAQVLPAASQAGKKGNPLIATAGPLPLLY